jgi:hypothetical protein
MVTQILFSVSSTGGNRVQRKRIRVRTNLASVTGRKVKRDVACTNSNPDSKYGGHISDDSIGTLSTLETNQE